MMELDGRRKYYIKTRGKMYFELANIMLIMGLTLRQFLYKFSGRKSDMANCRLLKRLIYRMYYGKGCQH